ncbi:MAG: substrate-binding domain-containing protein [Acidobacteria bacterium]|nr:substrate-binding domain-containing protein [Acidobacteriota bacterium]
MSKDSETVEAVVRACRLLQSFHVQEEVLTLSQLVARTRLSKTTCFRLLQSLVKGGMIEQVSRGNYRSRLQPLRQSSVTLGFAAQTTDSEFSREVSQSLHHAAAREHIQLIAVDNRYSPKMALRNADLLIKEGVALVLEFQTYEHVAPIISSKFIEANIPVIAIEIPHPGATYFGADNYRAGVIGGQALGRWAKENWEGQIEAVLMLELPIAGSLPQLRITGTLAGLSETLSGMNTRLVTHLDGKGEFEKSLDVVRRYLRRTPPKRTLIAAVNDPSALGALRAFEEAGRGHLCAVMGQNATRDAREELRRPNTRLIGSVAYFPERYGEELIPMALSILQKKPVPASVFVKHQLITPKNISLIYPAQTD